MFIKKLFVMIMLAVPVFGICQQTIRGSVFSIDKEPLVGATVQILNTAQGNITDLNGNFEIATANEEEILIISFVGYISDTIMASSRETVIVALQEDSEKLEEVVVEAQSSTIDEMKPILNELISEKELLKAACCNLSESFETNASVDVSFSDAITGTKTIRMLGLDGRRLQTLLSSEP